MELIFSDLIIFYKVGLRCYVHFFLFLRIMGFPQRKAKPSTLLEEPLKQLATFCHPQLPSVYYSPHSCFQSFLPRPQLHYPLVSFANSFCRPLLHYRPNFHKKVRTVKEQVGERERERETWTREEWEALDELNPSIIQLARRSIILCHLPPALPVRSSAYR